MDTADAIREARQDAGFTQTELAKRSGTSQATISAYEHGAKTPTPATLARLLAATGWRLAAVPASSAVRIPTSDELQRRSGILARVIDLAERLPTRPERELRYPPLPKSRAA